MAADPEARPRGGGPPQGTELAGIGIQFTVVLLAFLFGGKWLDDRLGTEPWLLMGGVFVGFGLSLLWMLRRLRVRNGKDGT